MPAAPPIVPVSISRANEATTKDTVKSAGPNLEAFSEALHEQIAEANEGVTHADFVAGVRSGTVGFKCIGCEPHELIQGTGKTVFSILVLLYMIAPTVFVSLWAWLKQDWWLLLGFVVSGIGTLTASRLIYNQEKQYSIAAMLLIASGVLWFRFGIHSHVTFFALCGLWGLVLLMIADNAEKEYAMRSLVEHRGVFEDAIAKSRILVVRKGD